MAASNDNPPGSPVGRELVPPVGPTPTPTPTPSQRLAAMAAGAAVDPADVGSAAQAPAAAALIFLRVGRRWFGVPSAAVREVGTKGFVTRVPTTPAHVLGVTLVRGRLVPVLALEGLLGDLGPGEVAQTLPRLVILRHADTEIALVADETRGVIERRLESASEARRTAWEAAERPVFLGAELDWEGKLVCMLDVPALIAAATPGGTDPS
jgi:chemotaxis signal transduction protein